MLAGFPGVPGTPRRSGPARHGDRAAAATSRRYPDLQAPQPGGRQVAQSSELWVQGRGPRVREAVGLPPVAGRQRLDEAEPLQAGERAVQGARPEPGARERLDILLDGVAVLRAIG